MENARELLKLSDVKIVAVTDPAERLDLTAFYYRGQAGRLPTCAEIERHYDQPKAAFKCKQYEDFREMLDQEGGLDAVLCATPDHLHATVSLAAMRAMSWITWTWIRFRIFAIALMSFAVSA